MKRCLNLYVIGIVMSIGLGLVISNAYAQDWYESLESSTIDFSSTHNTTKAIEQTGNASVQSSSDTLSSEGNINSEISRELVSSDIQREIATQMASQIQILSSANISSRGVSDDEGEGGPAPPLSINNHH